MKDTNKIRGNRSRASALMGFCLASLQNTMGPRHVSSFKIIYFFCHNLKFKFCCQSCDVIFPPKTVKIEKQKKKDFWNIEFYHPAKFELKRITNAKAVPMLQRFVSYGPSVKRQQRNKYIWDLKDHFARRDLEKF